MWTVNLYLLEEHQTCPDHCSPPATSLEKVHPRSKFKLDPVAPSTLLQMRMPLRADLLLQCNFRADVEPFELDARVVRRQSAKFRKILQSFLIAAAVHEPAGREGEEDDPDTKDETWNDLEEEGETPGPF